jgi:hypothetical protein
MKTTRRRMSGARAMGARRKRSRMTSTTNSEASLHLNLVNRYPIPPSDLKPVGSPPRVGIVGARLPDHQNEEPKTLLDLVVLVQETADCPSFPFNGIRNAHVLA